MLSCTIQSGRSVSTRARIPKSEAFAGQGDVTLLPGPSGKVRGHDHDASRPACGQGPKLISRPSLLVIPSREQFNRRSRGGGKSENHAALAGFPSAVGKSCLWTFPRSGFFHGPLPTNTAIEPIREGPTNVSLHTRETIRLRGNRLTHPSAYATVNFGV